MSFLCSHCSDLYLIILLCDTVITQEKTIQNIEGFDKSKLKHADTAEKVVLPDEQGNILIASTNASCLRLFHRRHFIHSFHLVVVPKYQHTICTSVQQGSYRSSKTKFPDFP